MPVQINVDDTSPSLSYYPFRDTLPAPNLTAGWNPYYDISGFASSIGQIGNGTSYHITSMDGASISMKWHGNGIQLFGNTTLASYSITLDGADSPLNNSLSSNSSGILVDINNLQDGAHNITLTARIPQDLSPPNSSMLVFDKAIIKSWPDTALSNTLLCLQNVTWPLDNNSIAFHGRWSFELFTPGLSFHTSQNPGDRVTTSFNGTAFLLLGMTGPQAGNYSVTLDGTVTKLAGQSPFTVCNTSLYFATGLNASVEHSLQVENEGGKLSLLENGFITFVSDLQMLCPSPVGNTSMGTLHRGSIIAAFTTAGVLGFVILFAALYYCFVWKPRKQRERPHLTWPHRPGFDSPANQRKDVRSEVRGEGVGRGGRIYPSSSTESGFATWQREAVEGCTRGARLPVSFRRPSEGESSPSLETNHPYGRHSYFHVPKSGDVLRSPLNEESKNLKAIALANLKNKGKARQITGADSVGNSRRSETSLRSYLLQGLPFKRNVKGRSNSRRDSSPGSINFTLHSQSPISGYPRSPGEGDRDQVSSFHAADNPSPVDLRRDDVQVSIKRWSAIPRQSTRILSPLPSVPRSVSDSNPRTITRRRSRSPQHQRESRHFLLQEDEDPEDIYTRESEVDEKRNTVSSLSLHQVIRSLSPRTSEREKCDNRVSYRSFSYAFSDKLDEQPSGDENRIYVKPPSTNSDEEDVMSSVHFASVVSPSVVHMPPSATVQIPTAEKKEDAMNTIIIRGEEEQLAENHSPVLPNLRMTSPFDVSFDWRSERRQTRISRDVFSNANQDSQRGLFRKLSDKSQTLNVPHEFVQGTSRRTFRLTTSTLDHPLNFPLPPQSQRSSGIATSFLDFTSSSEGSARAKSSRTNFSEERIFGEPSPPESSLPELQGGGSPVLKSRWSTTTIPSISTRPRDLSRSREVTPNPSSSEHSSRPNTTRTSVHSAILPSIILTSDSHSMVINSAGHKSLERLNAATQASSENPIHIHPLTSDPESRSDILPHTVSDAIFQQSNIDDSSGSSSRRTSDSSNAFHARVLLASRYPPLPEGADEEEATTISRHSPAE